MDIVLIVVILQIVGTLAILSELLLPSLGLLSLAAIGFFAYSYWLVYQHSQTALIILVAINLISIPAALIFVVRRLKKSKLAALSDTIDSQAFVSAVSAGDCGVAVTDLRPAGSAQINGVHTDVYSEGGFISKGSQIKVVSTENAGIKVAQIQPASDYLPKE